MSSRREAKPQSVPAYKWLNGREATHVAGYRYRLGQWREAKGPLAPCENGLHLMRPEHLSRWIARDLFVAEYEGECIDAGDKLVVRRARIVEHLKGWNERTMRLAAADFAEAVLPIFEKTYPNDDRPRKAIQAARDYANDFDVDLAAARDAAWDAVDAAYAAEAAADAAARAARAVAAYAAYAAADAAARAAGDTAAYAAYAAYAAADAAARAARAAAYAAYAARAVAYAAYAARAAAARAAQGEIILDYAYGRRG